MPSKGVLRKAENYGCAVAVSLFAAMLNPQRRGQNWDWANLPKEAGEDAEATVLLSVCVPPRDESKIKRVAVEAARREAERLLKRSDILAWWPN